MSHFEIDQIKALLSGAGAKTFVVNTTGSTGEVKEIELSGQNLLASVNATHEYLGAKLGETWSLLLPTNHIAGINVLARSIMLQSELLGVDQVADYTAIVPTQLHNALNGDSRLLAHLMACKSVLVGGAATSDQLLEQAKIAGIKVVTTYGSSETCGGCIYNNKPLAGVEVEISELGFLKIKGPMVYKDGWYTSSDLAEIRNGEVFILGRGDDVIVSGGENISLLAVEKLLGENFIAFGISDDKWGTKLCLASNKPIDIQAISAKIEAAIGRHCIPKEFIEIDEIPLKGIGKPDRVRIQNIFLSK